jgi:hypothetical protein
MVLVLGCGTFLYSAEALAQQVFFSSVINDKFYFPSGIINDADHQ